MEGDLVVGSQVGGMDMLPSGTPEPYGDNGRAAKRELRSQRSPGLCFQVYATKVTVQRQHRENGVLWRTVMGRGCV